MTQRELFTYWLSSPSDDQRRHAEVRLSLLAGDGKDLGDIPIPTFMQSEESDAERAARLIAENPPENTTGVARPCGGCPDRASDLAGDASEQAGDGGS